MLGKAFFVYWPAGFRPSRQRPGTDAGLRGYAVHPVTHALDSSRRHHRVDLRPHLLRRLRLVRLLEHRRVRASIW